MIKGATLPGMKSIYDVRRENLRALMKTWGGPTSMAKKLGHANGSYLAQIAGPHPRRDISEKVAREIESNLGLALGYLDQTHQRSGGKIQDAAIADCVRAVGAALRDAGLKADPDRYAMLVQLAHDRVQLTGKVDEQYINQLIQLVRT